MLEVAVRYYLVANGIFRLIPNFISLFISDSCDKKSVMRQTSKTRLQICRITPAFLWQG